MKKIITSIALLLTFFFVVNGQNTHPWVTPLKSSFKDVWYFDSYINFSYSNVFVRHDNLGLNNGHNYHANERSFSIGMTFDLFKSRDKANFWKKGLGMTSQTAIKSEFIKKLTNLHYKFGIGYKRDRLFYSQDGQRNSGVYSNWLSLDAQVAFFVLTAGVKSDIYLNHILKNTPTFSYEGVYKDCFNPVTFYPYAGVFIGAPFFEFEARIGVGLPSHLNPDRIAYHNPYYSSVNVLYWEMRLSIRIFGLNNQL